MKAPKCRLCGECHWSHEAHVWPDDVCAYLESHPAANKAAPNSAPNKVVAPNTAPNSDAPNKTNTVRRELRKADTSGAGRLVATSGVQNVARVGASGAGEGRQTARSATWKAANPERYREYMRDYMRRKRATT